MDATKYTLHNLDLLAIAVDTLRDALSQHDSRDMRNTVVQCFQTIFELSRKTLHHYLLVEAATYAFYSKEVFREAGRQGIIADVDAWLTYLNGGNLTSHAFSNQNTEDTYRLAVAFLPDAQALLDELSKRCDARGQ